jgi:hypothetical protein
LNGKHEEPLIAIQVLKINEKNCGAERHHYSMFNVRRSICFKSEVQYENYLLSVCREPYAVCHFLIGKGLVLARFFLSAQ